MTVLSEAAQPADTAFHEQQEELKLQRPETQCCVFHSMKFLSAVGGAVNRCSQVLFLYLTQKLQKNI